MMKITLSLAVLSLSLMGCGALSSSTASSTASSGGGAEGCSFDAGGAGGMGGAGSSTASSGSSSSGAPPCECPAGVPICDAAPGWQGAECNPGRVGLVGGLGDVGTKLAPLAPECGTAEYCGPTCCTPGKLCSLSAHCHVSKVLGSGCQFDAECAPGLRCLSCAFEPFASCPPQGMRCTACLLVGDPDCGGLSWDPTSPG